MRTKYKAWSKPYIEEHKEVMLTLEELRSFNFFELEIGCGKGKFLIDMAQKNPDRTYVGIERNVTCVGITAKKIVDNQISNARIMHADVDCFINIDILKPDSLDRIYLNFSDPWPKKRHEKRRLTSSRYLNFYYMVLKKGGELIIKTDNDGLYQYTKETLSSSLLEMILDEENYSGNDSSDCFSEYELSFREKGFPIHRIKAIKK